jgi:hypothetical protein
MAKTKKQPFKLKPDWMLKKPVDFEYNKYTLLDYLQKCETNFNNLQIYPDFVELSLHLANIQSLVKENRLLITNKTFESCDDEILLKELFPKKPRQLTDNESDELDKTIKYSGNKLFDAFNMAKSIWNMAYDNMDLSLKRNKNNLASGRGYIFHYRKSSNEIFIWEYEIRKSEGDNFNNKTYMNLIFQSEPTSDTLTSIIETFSSWNNDEFYKDLPIFEMRCSNDFPLEQTFIPIMKRKIMAYVFQIVNLEKINNFDTEI